jgi:hypothetical protein
MSDFTHPNEPDLIEFTNDLGKVGLQEIRKTQLAKFLGLGEYVYASSINITDGNEAKTQRLRYYLSGTITNTPDNTKNWLVTVFGDKNEDARVQNWISEDGEMYTRKFNGTTFGTFNGLTGKRGSASLNTYNEPYHVVSQPTPYDGMLFVSLPKGFTNVSILAEVDIYDLSMGLGMTKMFISGFASSSNEWLNPAVDSVGLFPSNLVRLGSFNSKLCIVFGEEDTKWTSTSISIRSLTIKGADTEGWNKDYALGYAVDSAVFPVLTTMNDNVSANNMVEYISKDSVQYTVSVASTDNILIPEFVLSPFDYPTLFINGRFYPINLCDVSSDSEGTVIRLLTGDLFYFGDVVMIDRFKSNRTPSITAMPTIKRQWFTASAGQSAFTLTNGSYITNKNRISVYRNGLRVHSDALTETSPTSFTLSAASLNGDKVYAEWYEQLSIPSYLEGHNGSHSMGGDDAITPAMIGAFTSQETTALLDAMNSSLTGMISAITPISLAADATNVEMQNGTELDRRWWSPKMIKDAIVYHSPPTTWDSLAAEVTLGEMQSGSSTVIKWWTPKMVKDAVVHHSPPYTHPSGFANQPATALTGANVVSQVTVNTNGHVTGVTSRSITLPDINSNFNTSTTAPTGTPRLNYDGHFYATLVNGAVWGADYAECVPYDSTYRAYEQGDILAINPDDSNYFTLAIDENAKLAVGIVSSKEYYGMLIGGEPSPKNVPLGLAGRLPVKVVGVVNAGDEIIPSSIPGVGKVLKLTLVDYLLPYRINEKKKGVIGKAIESSKTPGIKRVKVFLK